MGWVAWMCGRVMVMAIGVINVPMCQSFSDTPGSLRVGVLGGEAGERRWAVFDKYGRDSICKQGRTLDF